MIWILCNSVQYGVKMCTLSIVNCVAVCVIEIVKLTALISHLRPLEALSVRLVDQHLEGVSE